MTDVALAAVSLAADLVAIASVNPGLMPGPACGPAADLAARLGAVLGTGSTFDALYWMEVPLWQAVCPTLVCGPSGCGLHALDEWVDVRQVQAYAAALPGVLTSWAAGRRAD